MDDAFWDLGNDWTVLPPPTSTASVDGCCVKPPAQVKGLPSPHLS